MSIYIIFANFLFSCGDLDVLGTGGEYVVDGLVDGVSLDECAVISSESRIEPYFDCDIAGDSDTQILRVVIKNFSGKIAAVPLRYELGVTESSSEEEKSEKKEAETAKDDSGESTDGSKNDQASSKNSALPDGESEKISEDTTELDDSTASDDKKNTDEQTNAEKDKQPDTEKTENLKGVEDFVVKVDRLDKDLPAFSFPVDADSGFYYISFQVISKSGELLQVVEKPIYYLGRNALSIEDIQSYLPGVSQTPYVVPPSSPVLLEARIKASETITPYIIWYCGKERIAEGQVKNGVFRFLWKSPEETGFQPIKAEILPFNPLEEGFGVHGLSREMSLPVSLKHERHGYFDAGSGDLSFWYEFGETLRNSKDMENEAAYLVSVSKKPLIWFPFSSTYGLPVGEADIWTFPAAPFKHIEKNGGNALLQVRFAALNNGSLLETELFDKDSGFAYKIRLDVFDFALILTCEKQGTLYRAETPLIKDDDGFSVASLNFNFSEEYITIDIGCEKRGRLGSLASISIPGSADGTGNIYFGKNSLHLEENDFEVAILETAVISEIALSYPDLSPVSAEIEEGDTDDSENENENAEEETVAFVTDLSYADETSRPKVLLQKINYGHL